MKALCVGVFNPKNIHQASPMAGDNVFAKGLEKNGWEVRRFDYREVQYPNNVLIDVAAEYQPDLFWFGKCELISPLTLLELRKKVKNAIFVKWATDVRNVPVPLELEHNKQMDWYFGTFGGDWLKTHLMPGMKGVASMITFTDSDLFYQTDVADEWSSEVLFTGRTNFRDPEVDRVEYLQHLEENQVKLKWYGQDEWIQFPEYLYAINGAKIGLGLTHFVRPLYSSDRLGNYTSCGTFYLAQYFPGIEKVFTQNEIAWFKTKEECLTKIKFYLEHEQERKEMAIKTSAKVLQHFDAKPLVKNLLNIIETGKSNYDFDDVFIN